LTKDEIDRLAADLEKQLKKLDSKREEIQEKLKNLLHQRKAFTVVENAFSQSPERTLSESSSVSQKIALIRSFFRGREDLYAQRWESAKTGKTGYQPVCKNDWIRGICRKPEIKCGNCAAREFVPISDSVFHRHLFGCVAADRNAHRTRKDFVIGIYPLLQNETCWFLAADFDKESWKTDVSAFRATCRRFNVLLAVGRSRSGNGAHACLFFSEPIPVIFARRLGLFLLTRIEIVSHESSIKTVKPLKHSHVERSCSLGYNSVACSL